MGIGVIRRMRPTRMLALALLLALVSCDSMSKFGAVEPRLPPLADGMARLWLLRGSDRGGLTRPTLQVGDRPLGALDSNGFLFADLDSGSTFVRARWTMHRAELQVSLVAGEQHYVHMVVNPRSAIALAGGRRVITLEATDAESARGMLPELRYCGAEDQLQPRGRLHGGATGF